MNNHPFKEWLLEENLQPDEKDQLKDHLKNCKECSDLAQAWQETQAVLKDTQFVEPQVGYSERWIAFQAQKRMQKQRRLAWALFFFLFILIILGLYFLYAPSIAQFSPGELLAILLSHLTVLILNLRRIDQFFKVLFSFIPPILPVLFWVLGTLSLTSLSIIWLFLMWKIIVPKAPHTLG